MSLGDWQAAVGGLVVTRASGRPTGSVLDGLRLTAGERDWLNGLAGSPGFEVTCRVQRWWRGVRLRWAARLTLGALGAGRSARVIDAYLDAVPAFSLFFVPEALRFLEFAPAAAPEVPHLASVARFEHALLSTTQVVTGSAAAGVGEVVAFAAPPEELLDAILSGDPLPPVGEEYLVLVSASLPHRWRVLTGSD
jgi:hypothetical protein